MTIKQVLLEDTGAGPAPAPAFVESGLDDHTVRGAVRVGFKLKNFGLQQDGFKKLVEVGLFKGRNLHLLNIAAQAPFSVR